MELTRPRRSGAWRQRSPRCSQTRMCVVDFTRPDTALENALACMQAGVHVVIGTTGFDIEPLRAARTPAGLPQAKVLIAPNFAIGAVLMMRFAAEAARHMEKAEIVELHHDRKLDAPSGTAARTARLMAEASGGAEPPIHSVRLPGLVAHQEVILGDLGETLTIRHDSIDRASFMPGVLLAIRRVGEPGVLAGRRSRASVGEPALCRIMTQPGAWDNAPDDSNSDHPHRDRDPLRRAMCAWTRRRSWR